MKTVGALGSPVIRGDCSLLLFIRNYYVLKTSGLDFFKTEEKFRSIRITPKTIFFISTLFFLSFFTGNAQNTDPHDYPGNEITGIPSEKVMLILDVTVIDSLRYNEYESKVAPLIKKYGGVYQVRSGGMAFDADPNRKVLPIEGQWNPNRFIILRWNSMEQLQNFTTCDEYKSITALREQSATTKSIIVKEYSQL